jgi:hypothetical protein
VLQSRSRARKRPPERISPEVCDRVIELRDDPPETLRRTRGGPEGYDGVAQLWWDSFEDMASRDPAAAEAGRLLLEDEKRFIDLEQSPLWWGEEKVIF